MNSVQLLQQCQSGDELAIQALIQAHRGALYRLAVSILLDPDEAEEAVQDAFIAALNAMEMYNGGALHAWLYGITLNECRQRLRRRKALDRLRSVLQSLLRLGGAGPIHPETTVIENETDTLLWRAVCALGEKHRLPIILYYYHDLPVAEIARLLDISEGTAHSRLFNAREKLRKALGGRVLSGDEEAPGETAGAAGGVRNGR